MKALLPFLLLIMACEPRGFKDPSREFGDPLPDGDPQADVIHKPDPLGVWHSPLADDPTVPKQAACVTCHGPNPKGFAAAHPGERFHTNIELHHGTLNCNQCHDQDRTLLHLADGTTFDFSDTMRLCGQCHGPQYRDYTHGSHGGMKGTWDTRQGPRNRNNCIDCHSPHAPAFKGVMPVFPPQDRYLGGPEESETEGQTEGEHE